MPRDAEHFAVGEAVKLSPGLWLRWMRERQGFTQAGLATKASVNATQISHWEREQAGRGAPAALHLYCLLQALQAPQEWVEITVLKFAQMGEPVCLAVWNAWDVAGSTIDAGGRGLIWYRAANGTAPVKLGTETWFATNPLVWS